MTEAEAATIVRRILARPTNQAFDCAAGSIVRLYARIEVLEKRVRTLERSGPGNGYDHLTRAPRPRRSRRHSAGSTNQRAADEVEDTIDKLAGYRARS
jgi:hypothetical protein